MTLDRTVAYPPSIDSATYTMLSPEYSSMRGRYARSRRSAKSRTNSFCSSGVRSGQCRVSVRRAISSKSKRAPATRRSSARPRSPCTRKPGGGSESDSIVTTRVTAACTTSRGPAAGPPDTAAIKHTARIVPMLGSPAALQVSIWRATSAAAVTARFLTFRESSAARRIMTPLSAMSVAGRRRNRVVVGVDLGGTWVRVLALAEGGSVTRVTTRAPQAHDMTRFLRRVWRQRGWHGRVISLVVATRGVWTPRERRTVRARLRGLAPRVRVISDAEAAWMGALESGAGVLILAGTGSIVLARTARGRWARAGGLGPLLGDEGSAFWLGREWLRASGRDARALRALATSPAPVARIAAHAPAVVARARRGDRTALRVVRAAQDHLATLAAGVAAELNLRPPVPVGGAGSVMRDPWFRAGVERALARHGVRACWHAHTVEPVVAAARLAAR